LIHKDPDFIVTITKVMEVNIEADLMLTTGSTSLCPSLLVAASYTLAHASKLFNKFIKADPGVLTSCLVGLFILDKHLAKAFSLTEDGIHESDELSIIVLVRLKLT
jgi:hypothetical protein